jgi:hypothetical protein
LTIATGANDLILPPEDVAPNAWGADISGMASYLLGEYNMPTSEFLSNLNALEEKDKQAFTALKL